MKFLKKLVPAYSWLPLIICIAINMLCYQGTRFVRGLYDARYFDVSLPIDDMIPLFAPSVVIYLGCYITWLASYWMIAREEKKISHNFFVSEIIGKIIAMAFYILLPTCLVRPEITGTDIFSEMLKFVYSTDTPDNLFPSLHCFASWMAWRGLLPCKKVPKWYRNVAFVTMFLVFASVVLTKQHLFIDIFGGIAVAELGILIARLTKAERIFDRKKHRDIPEKTKERETVEIK